MTAALLENPGPAGVLRGLVAMLRGAPAALPAGVPDPCLAAERLAGGVPALTGEALISWSGLLRNAAGFANVLAGTEGHAAANLAAERLGRAAGIGDPEAVCEAAIAGRYDYFGELAPRLAVDLDALATVADFAARPALCAGAAALRPTLAATHWRRGRCPACGAAPALSALHGKEHERRLHCARCGTGWPFPRVRCPSCGEDDHRRLAMLHAEGEGEYRRVDVCDSCRGYVKTVSLLDVPDAGRVLELDFETAALDFLALEHGYSHQAWVASASWAAASDHQPPQRIAPGERRHLAEQRGQVEPRRQPAQKMV